MARLSEGESDKVLWLTLAQSWVKLAEHVALAHEHAEEGVAWIADDEADELTDVMPLPERT